MAINTVIATNVIALNTDRYLGIAKKKQSVHGNRLSSGKKLNSASDDAAGVAISQKMKAQIRGLNMAEKNTQDTISFLEVIEGALNEVTEISQRCRELSVQAANDTNTVEDRRKIATEMLEIVKEIEGILDRTEFNGTKVFSQDTEKTFQIGANIMQSLSFKLEDISFDDLMSIKDEELYQKVKNLFVETVKVAIENVLAQDPYAIGNICIIYGIDTALCDFKSFLDPIFTTIDDLDTVGLDIISKLKEEMKNELEEVIAETRRKTEDELLRRFNGVFNGSMWLGNSIGTGSLFNPEDSIPVEPDNLPMYPNSVRVSSDMVLDAIRSLDKIVAIDSDLDRDDPNSFPNRLESVLKNYSEKFENADYYKYNLFIELEQFVNGEKIISSSKFSETYITHFDKIISIIGDQRSKVGAIINRLEYTSDSLKVSSENLSLANSYIEDADMAFEIMGLTASNILIQASTTLLAQANSSKESVISLLQ